MGCGAPAGTSDGRWRQGQTRDQYLLMKPQGLFGEHGELLVRDGIQIDAGKVMTDVNHPLPDALVVRHDPPAYQFTSRL